MLSYPSGMAVSNRALQLLAEALRRRRGELRTRWRRLDAGWQALLVVAYLRKGETYADLTCGFAVGVTTVYRYLREGLALLAATTLVNAVQALDPETGTYRPLSLNQKQVNAAHARLRGPGERANAQLKSWKILRRIRSSAAYRPLTTAAHQPLQAPRLTASSEPLGESSTVTAQRTAARFILGAPRRRCLARPIQRSIPAISPPLLVIALDRREGLGEGERRLSR